MLLFTPYTENHHSNAKDRYYRTKFGLGCRQGGRHGCWREFRNSWRHMMEAEAVTRSAKRCSVSAGMSRQERLLRRPMTALHRGRQISGRRETYRCHGKRSQARGASLRVAWAYLDPLEGSKPGTAGLPDRRPENITVFVATVPIVQAMGSVKTRG
jgi:hypothetical protein